jgi:hypothetical protein
MLGEGSVTEWPALCSPFWALQENLCSYGVPILEGKIFLSSRPELTPSPASDVMSPSPTLSLLPPSDQAPVRTLGYFCNLG